MKHTLITIEGNGQSHAREIARTLSLRLGCPAMPLEALYVATAYRWTPQSAVLAAQTGGQAGFFTALFGISARQGTLFTSRSRRWRERRLAAKLLRCGPFILVGDGLHEFCAAGLPKLEAYVFVGKEDPSGAAVQYPKAWNQGKGYDITLDSSVLSIEECAEEIEKSLPES